MADVRGAKATGRACWIRAGYHAVLGVKGSRQEALGLRQTLDASAAA